MSGPMELVAYSTGGVALIIAAAVALTGEGTRRDRMARFAIPGPLYVGAPVCGLLLGESNARVVVDLANAAIAFSVLGLAALIAMVAGVMWESGPTAKN